MTSQPREEQCLYEIAETIAAFFQKPEPEIRARLRHEFQNPGAGVAAAWTAAAPKTPEEITRFYETTDAYVFDLAADHCRERRRLFWEKVKRRLRRAGAKDVLAYGDGIGTESIELARAGYRVAYFDLPGVSSDFARFRCARDGLDDAISFLNSPDAVPSSDFDAVLCVEVLEHLVDPIDAMRRIHRALREGGIVLLTESFESVGAEFPSHLESNLQYAGRTHQLMESMGFASTYINRDPINRPMEFTKVGPGARGSLLRLWGRAKRAVRTRTRYLRRG